MTSIGKQKIHRMSSLQQIRVLLQWMATIDGLTSFDYLEQKKFQQYGEQEVLDCLKSGTSIYESLALMD